MKEVKIALMAIDRKINDDSTDGMLCKLWKWVKLYITNRWILVIVLKAGRGCKSQKIICGKIPFYKVLNKQN